MGELEHVTILQDRGVRAWNRWRRQNPNIIPRLEGLSAQNEYLSGVNFRGAILAGATFTDANLERANLKGADLRDAHLYGAEMWQAQCQDVDFRDAYLMRAHLSNVSLQRADMRKADCSEADFFHAKMQEVDLTDALLRGANLTEANLDRATLRNSLLVNAALVRTSLRSADLRGADVYGSSVWDVITNQHTKQSDLITDSVDAKEVRDWFSGVTVDNLNVAHFIALIQRTEVISDLIDESANRVVLLLGRFSREGKPVLERLAGKLRSLGYLPIIFDFRPPKERDLTETVKVLASLSRFVVADLTQPRSAPLELHAIVPHLMVPVVPIIKHGDTAFSMFGDLQRKYFWVLPPVRYRGIAELLENVENGIVKRADRKRAQIRRLRRVASSKPERITEC